jgi:dimethylaniline monooxygenase (N-oxide forming)
MPATLVPAEPLPAGFESIGIGGEFYEFLQRGRLAAVRGRPTAFTATGIELDTGDGIAADLLVFATGWLQSVAFLAPELHDLVRADGCFRLYRHILPPEEPRLGFVGYPSSTACQFTSEVAAHWLSQLYRGELMLPNIEEMNREIDSVRQWASEAMPARHQGYFIGPYVAHYVDDLLRDMGLRTRRTGNALREWFGLLSPSRYATLGAEREARRRRAPSSPCKGRRWSRRLVWPIARDIAPTSNIPFSYAAKGPHQRADCPNEHIAASL